MQRITYTQGNTVSVSVPLVKKTIEKTGNVTSITTEDYTPGDGETIEVKLIGERRTYCYTPTMSESVAVFALQGNEVAGRYGIEVNIYKTNGEKMRYAEPYALELVPFTGIVDNFVVGAVELDASVFFAMRGEKGDKGDPGEDGVGISSITKVSTQGLVDNYAITYTDGTSTTFQVTNGAKGDTGATGATGADGRGIVGIAKTASHGLIDTYTIEYTDRTTSTYQVTNGAKGDTGNGIASIVKTGTSGLVDTYTITYTDGTTSTYQVTNGEDAEGGVIMGKIDGVQFYKVVSFNASGTPTFSDTAEVGDPLKTYIDILTRQMYWYNPMPLPPVPGSSHYRNLADENVRVYEVSGATPSTNLLPNAFYKFTGAVTSLTLTLGTPTDGITNIYAFSFVAGAANPTISLPASVTIDGTPSIASGDYVEFNIMNNVALFKVVTI